MKIIQRKPIWRLKFNFLRKNRSWGIVLQKVLGAKVSKDNYIDLWIGEFLLLLTFTPLCILGQVMHLVQALCAVYFTINVECL